MSHLIVELLLRLLKVAVAGVLALIIYSIATSAYADFFDIISGTNGAFFCNPGYDMVTGLGSPNAPGLVPAMSAAK